MKLRGPDTIGSLDSTALGVFVHTYGQERPYTSQQGAAQAHDKCGNGCLSCYLYIATFMMSPCLHVCCLGEPDADPDPKDDPDSDVDEGSEAAESEKIEDDPETDPDITIGELENPRPKLKDSV